MEKSKGVLNSARGGETHDWLGEDVMSRPAREALPQRSPPRPTPAPTGGASALSAGLGGHLWAPWTQLRITGSSPTTLPTK